MENSFKAYCNKSACKKSYTIVLDRRVHYVIKCVRRAVNSLIYLRNIPNIISEPNTYKKNIFKHQFWNLYERFPLNFTKKEKGSVLKDLKFI